MNNKSTSEKRNEYEFGRLKCMSLKQALMLSYDDWDENKIKEHHKNMIELLDKNAIENNTKS